MLSSINLVNGPVALSGFIDKTLEKGEWSSGEWLNKEPVVELRELLEEFRILEQFEAEDFLLEEEPRDLKPQYGNLLRKTERFAEQYGLDIENFCFEKSAEEISGHLCFPIARFDRDKFTKTLLLGGICFLHDRLLEKHVNV